VDKVHLDQLKKVVDLNEGSKELSDVEEDVTKIRSLPSSFYNKMAYYKQKYKRKKKFGVPIGYRENWKYVGRWRERKVAPGRWIFRFQASKGRKAKSYGSFGKGTTGSWYIKGIQRIKKTGKGRYQTDLVGTKRSLGFKVKKNYRY